MAKAKLIKRTEITEREQAKKATSPQKNNVQKTMNAVIGWIDNTRAQREDPRKAFAALFTRPQPQ